MASPTNTDKDLADQLFNEFMESLDKLNKVVNQILDQSIAINKATASALKQTSKVILK